MLTGRQIQGVLKRAERDCNQLILFNLDKFKTQCVTKTAVCARITLDDGLRVLSVHRDRRHIVTFVGDNHKSDSSVAGYRTDRTGSYRPMSVGLYIDIVSNSLKLH